MNINNIKEVINKYLINKKFKDQQDENKMNLLMVIISSVVIGLIPLVTLIVNKEVSWKLTLGTLTVSAITMCIGTFFYKKVSKTEVEIEKIDEELFSFLIENEKEIIKLMGKNLGEGDMNFADLKFNFINKDYDKVMDYLRILMNNSIEGKYSVEEQIKISQYDIDMSFAKEKEMNYSYNL